MTNQPAPTDEGISMSRFAYYGIVAPEDEAAASDLAPAELSSLAQMIQAQIEYHLREIERLEEIVSLLKEHQKEQDNEQPN